MKNTFKSDSILKKRIRKFKSIKRGYYSLIILICLFIFSVCAPFFINDQALYVKYKNKSYYPSINKIVTETSFLQNIFKLKFYTIESEFGDEDITSYRLLKKEFENNNSNNYVMMPIYPYGPLEYKILLELTEKYEDTNKNGQWDKSEYFVDTNKNGKWDKYTPATKPNWYPALCNILGWEISNDSEKYTPNILGTDNQGRDVFARIIYGFKVSFLFALIVWFLSYTLGIAVGSIIGYKGGKVDLFGYRIIEIYSSIPFMFLLMILASFMKPNIYILALLYVILTGWISISWYVRGEFLREKSKDYVSAAISMGQSHTKIIFKHILPNALTSIITNAPFAIVGYITGLVALDYLGFGLQPPTPSWGELIAQGANNIQYWHLVLFPLICLAITLFLISLVGEAARSAFDPKVHSRLR